MVKQPLISIIIPVYNASEYLEQCLESILGQSYQTLQVLCVDDFSTDNSLEILHKYAKIDERVEVITKRNEGVSLARNLALDNILGEYVLFVDSDDWIDLHTCEIAMDYAQKEDYDVVMWTYYRERRNESLDKRIYEKNIEFGSQMEVRDKLHRRMVGILDDELRRPENADALCTVWGKLYRAEIIQKHKIRFYDIRKIGTYEDGLFNLDFFFYVSKAMFINEPLYHYRRTVSNSVTNSYNPELRNQWKRLFYILDNYVAEHQLGKNYEQALSNRIALSVIPLGINAVSNSGGLTKQFAEIKEIVTDEKYIESIKMLNKSYFPIHWKVFFGLAKHKNILGLYLLLRGIQKIRGK